MNTVIDWTALWEEYGLFHDSQPDVCEWWLHKDKPGPQASMQKIQELVERQLKELVERHQQEQKRN